jgi:hypothetical protein
MTHSHTHSLCSKFVANAEEGTLKDTLIHFFAREPKQEDETFELASPDVIRTLLTEEKAFDLEYLQRKIEIIVNRWDHNVFGRKDPALIRLKYRVPPHVADIIKVAKERRTSTPRQSLHESVVYREGGTPNNGFEGEGGEEDIKPRPKTDEEIEALRQGRADLGTQHGDDPLEASREMAAHAKRRRNGDDDDDEDFTNGDEMMTPPKSKRARGLAFSNELDRDDEEDAEERAKLSELPDRARSNKSKRSAATAFRGTDPDDGIFDQSTGLVLKRRRWTDEEKTAVKEGVKAHGVGHWVKIKDDYPEILRNRTAIQIKDCWRTMTKRHEVEDIEEDDNGPLPPLKMSAEV